MGTPGTRIGVGVGVIVGVIVGEGVGVMVGYTISSVVGDGVAVSAITSGVGVGEDRETIASHSSGTTWETYSLPGIPIPTQTTAARMMVSRTPKKVRRARRLFSLRLRVLELPVISGS